MIRKSDKNGPINGSGAEISLDILTPIGTKSIVWESRLVPFRTLLPGYSCSAGVAGTPAKKMKLPVANVGFVKTT